MVESNELNTFQQIVAGDGSIPVSWDEPQASAIFEAFDSWFKSQLPILYQIMERLAPGVVHAEARNRFVKAFMRVKAVRLPARRLAPKYYDDAWDFYRELEAQTDRAVAIVGAAFLDAKLETALKLCVVPGLSESDQNALFKGPTAPLGSLAGRALVGHALGLIGPKSFADLGLIGRIRNRFAHRLDVVSFSQPDIAELCSKLQIADFVVMGQNAPHAPRERFVHSVVNIMPMSLD